MNCANTEATLKYTFAAHTSHEAGILTIVGRHHITAEIAVGELAATFMAEETYHATYRGSFLLGGASDGGVGGYEVFAWPSQHAKHAANL